MCIECFKRFPNPPRLQLFLPGCLEQYRTMQLRYWNFAFTIGEFEIHSVSGCLYLLATHMNSFILDSLLLYVQHRAIWPSDDESELNDEAVEGETVPRRSDAFTETGNKADTAFNEDVDAIESSGVNAVLLLAQRVAIAAEASEPNCNEGSRGGATRSQLAVRSK